MPIVGVDEIACHDQIYTVYLAGILLLSPQPGRRTLLRLLSVMFLLCYAQESHNTVGHVG